MAAQRLHGDCLKNVYEIIASDVTVPAMVLQLDSIIYQPFTAVFFKNHVVAV
ncbi:MAG: hypothetical protein L6W00_04135 [Lentisphaeria bacterium]|nr:MAG: hypothetical protein L6W00_04135 [Lentisphaeria bacterium]